MLAPLLQRKNMFTVLERKQLSKNEIHEFLNSGRGNRFTPYREILDELNSKPFGFKIKFKVPSGFKFHAPYTTAESMGFTFSYKTISKNTIEMVKLESKNKKFVNENGDVENVTLTNVFNDIFDAGEKLPVYQYDGHGSMPKIIDMAFRKIGDEAIILAKSDKTIRTNANKKGIALSIKRVSKALRSGGLSEYRTLRVDSDNSYVRSARKHKI